MGKAYTEKEKEEIKKRLWEEGLKIFHTDGAKGINVRELTKKTGISLGSFYTFYSDKNSFVEDIMKYRSKQKLDLIKSTFNKSEKEPAKYLANIIYDSFTDMNAKIDNKPIYTEAFKILEADKAGFKAFFVIFENFLEDLNSYWDVHKLSYRVDPKGISHVIIGIWGVYRVQKAMEDNYFDNILKSFIEAGCARFITGNEK